MWPRGAPWCAVTAGPAASCRRMLVMADTCEASTLGEQIESPNVLFVASSLRGENSYSVRSRNTMESVP